MNTILSLLRDFLAAQQTQQETKRVFLDKHIGDEGYAEAQSDFRRADDRFEQLFEQVVPALQQAHVDDATDEVVESLGEQAATALRRILSDRGLHALLEANANTGLANIIRKYRKASALYSAARELNARRRQMPDDFETLLETAPAGVDAEAWAKVVKMLTDAESVIEDDPDFEDSDADDITREAAYRVENSTRKRYDELTERLVSVFRDLMDRGAFDLAVSELEPEDRKAAYDLQRQVPQPQRQTQTKPAPRPVELLDEVTDEEAQGMVDDLLNDLGLQ